MQPFKLDGSKGHCRGAAQVTPAPLQSQLIPNSKLNESFVAAVPEPWSRLPAVNYLDWMAAVPIM